VTSGDTNGQENVVVSPTELPIVSKESTPSGASAYDENESEAAVDHMELPSEQSFKLPQNDSPVGGPAPLGDSPPNNQGANNENVSEAEEVDRSRTSKKKKKKEKKMDKQAEKLANTSETVITVRDAPEQAVVTAHFFVAVSILILIQSSLLSFIFVCLALKTVIVFNLSRCQTTPSSPP
jgi:hypothetical protein